jgi:uncharacterized SAM-binding protein YcdF (DUF218 family)
MKALQQPELVLAPPAEGALLPSWAMFPLAVLRHAAFAVLALVAAWAIGFGLFAHHVSRLATPVDPGAADAIIVLTGGQARIDAALDLLKSGKGERLLISGVNPRASRDTLRAVTGSERSLFNCCVDIDRAALDTVGNAEESAKWVASHAYRTIILVTNNYHMPRTLLEMGRLLDGAELRPYPVVNTKLGDGAWLTKPGVLRVLFTEYTKYLAALARSALPPRDLADSLRVVNASAAAE